MPRRLVFAQSRETHAGRRGEKPSILNYPRHGFIHIAIEEPDTENLLIARSHDTNIFSSGLYS
jgi:hypothetical protein